MASFFDLVAQLQASIDALDKILAGGDTETVLVDGVNKSTISKAIKDNFSALQAMVQGSLAFTTKALMDADTGQAVDTIAQVWNDSTKSNNGLYGWNGTIWDKSPLDVSTEITQLGANLVKFNAQIAHKQQQTVTLDSDGHYPIIVDAANNVALAVTLAGEIECILSKLSADTMVEKSINITEVNDPEVALAIVDEFNKMALSVDMTGKVSLHSELIKPDSSGLSDINHILVRGQSLSQGYNAGGAVSLTQDLGNLTFNSYVQSTVFSELTPLIEKNNGIFGESPASGICAQARILSLGRYNYIDPSKDGAKFLASIHSISGTDIDGLNKGNVIYDQVQDAVAAGSTLARLQGLSYSVAGIFWVQGEANEGLRTDKELYKSALIQLKNDHTQDIGLELSRPWINIPFITYQTDHRYSYNTPITALAQLDAAKQDADIFMATPIYYLAVSDHTHMTPHSSRWLGEQMGKVWHIVHSTGNWKPLSPEVIYKKATRTIQVQFHVPKPPMVFDENMVTNPGDYGFEVIDDTGRLSLLSVKIIDSNTIEIITDTDIGANPYLRYAYTSYGNAGPITGARGNLRDSDPTVSYHNNEISNKYPLFNWCVTFSEAIEE
jgi:hypothetical protein